MIEKTKRRGRPREPPRRSPAKEPKTASGLGKGGDWAGNPARFPMFGHDGGVNAAPDVEFGGQAQEPGSRRRDEILQYLVGYGFVECAAVAVRPDIQLQSLEFHAACVRDVLEFQGGKIRLSGF